MWMWIWQADPSRESPCTWPHAKKMYGSAGVLMSSDQGATWKAKVRQHAVACVRVRAKVRVRARVRFRVRVRCVCAVSEVSVRSARL